MIHDAYIYILATSIYIRIELYIATCSYTYYTASYWLASYLLLVELAIAIRYMNVLLATTGSGRRLPYPRRVRTGRGSYCITYIMACIHVSNNRS